MRVSPSRRLPHTEPPTRGSRPSLFMGKSRRSEVTTRASDRGGMAESREK